MNRFRNFAWFTLGFCILVILWGAYVRATGSGAGCGRHWPLCNGVMIPREARTQTLVEYSHRLSSGISLLLVIALYIWNRRLFPKGSFSRKVGFLALIAILIEAAIGAMLVLLRLVEHDQSIDRAVSISLHLGNTLFLLASISLTALAPSAENPRWDVPDRRFGFWTHCLLGGFVALGALGALTALGDTLFPVGQAGASAALSGGKRHFLEQIRILHPFAALAWFAGLLLWIMELPEQLSQLRPRAFSVLAVAGFNLALGLFNVWMKAPISIQIAHLFVANVLWVLLVSLVFSTASKWR